MARQLGANPTRVNRLLKTLAYLGIARQTANRKYTPGPGMHVLAAQSLFASGLIRRAMPVLEDLRRFGHTVAMGVLFDAVRRANVAVDAGDNQSAASVASAVREMCIAVGLQLDVAKEVDADAQAKATALDAARAAKDFATADKLRAELQALGYLVETTKAGTTLRRG